MNLFRGLTTFLAAGMIFSALTSCGPMPTVPTPQQRRMYLWNDDGGPGKVAVRINLETQRAFFTRGGRPIGWSYVATGKEGFGTPAGSFKITEKVIDKYSNAYGWIEDEYGNVVNGDAKPSTPVPAGCTYVPAPMPYWMRLTNWGIGMHAGLIPQPGTPASHGCIRLPKRFAPILFEAVDIGTSVKIEKKAPRPVPSPPALPAQPVTGVPPSSEYPRRYLIQKPVTP